MRRAIPALLLCPALLSCSVWLDLDKSKLEGYPDAAGDGPAEVTDDTEGDTDADAPMDVPGDTPDDVSPEGPCPDARECDGDGDCDDLDACTADRCEMECGVCVHTPVDGLTVVMDDFQIRNMEVLSSSPTKVVWTGSVYGAAWGYAPTTDPTHGEIWFATFTATGPEPSAIRLTDNSEDDYSPKIAWTESEFGIAWTWDDGDSSKIRFVTVQTDGSPSGIQDVVTSTEWLGEADLAWGSGGYGLTWAETSSGQTDIWFAPLTTTGSMATPATQVTDEGTPAMAPSIAFTGSEYGIAFQDARDDPPGDPVFFEIYFQSMAPSGGALLLSDLRVTSTPGYSSEAPDLVWSGSEYAVAWHDYRDGASPEIYFSRISGDGVEIGSDLRLTYETSTFSTDASLARGVNEYGLVYNSNGALIFLRLGDDGTDSGVRLMVGTHPVRMGPDILWNGTAGHMAYGIGWQGPDGEFFNLVKDCTGG